MRAVYIKWLDSEAAATWEDIDTISDSLDITETVGWLVKETNQFYLVALSFDRATNSVICFKKIPRVAVVGRIKYLKI